MTNFQANAQEGAVILTYELEDPTGSGAEILFHISIDKGRTWKNPKGASGEVLHSSQSW